MFVPKAEQIRLKSKMWLELKGRPIMGEGRMAMLQAIDVHRSILHASQETGISYRRIRGAIHDMETVLGQTLVLTRRGGREGGGYAELTPPAMALLDAFKTLSQGFQDASDVRFKDIFR
jgi:molybdate transport system regulatory protein